MLKNNEKSKAGEVIADQVGGEERERGKGERGGRCFFFFFFFEGGLIFFFFFFFFFQLGIYTSQSVDCHPIQRTSRFIFFSCS